MVLRYIGYGTTDSNGIAKLDHDAEGNVIEGYTGTGEGDIVFVASTDENPSSSSILSNRVDVYDSPLQKSVLLTVSNNPVLVGTSVTLTATVTEDEEAIVGETVSFKVGSTVIGTSETDSNGVATYTYTTTVGGNLSVSAVWDNVTSNIVNLTVTKKNTLLSISVPQLVYTDVFDVTGVLTDANNVGIEGASVKLYINHNGATSLQATGTTDSNGEITFHNDKVTSITTYQFWLEFEGNDTYADSMSSKESVTPDAETSVLTVTSPVNNSTYYADAPVVVAGTLLTNDGEAIANQLVQVYGAYIRTDSNGAFNTTLNDDMLDELPIGENTITIQFDSVTEYTQSTTSRKITLVQPDLTSDKEILSSADSDSATITATFGKSGQSVTLYDASDDSVVGSMVDEGDGVYSYDYASVGVGDVTFYAKYGDFTRSFLTKTFTIEDCWYYNDGTKDDLTYQSGDFGSVVSEGLQLKGTTNSYQKAVMPTSLFSTNDNVSCEIKLGTYNESTPQLALYDSSYTTQGSVNGSTINNIRSELSSSPRTVRDSVPAVNEVWKITRENGQSKFYIDDVLLDTVTRSVNNFRFGFYTYNNRTEVIKYIKIKPL